MARVEVDPDALEDLDRIYDFIGRQQQRPQAADNVVDRIHEACQRYATQPAMGEPRPDLAREVRVFSTERYVVIYIPLADGIRVLRIFDGSRNYPALFRGSS